MRVLVLQGSSTALQAPKVHFGQGEGAACLDTEEPDS